MNAAPKLHLIKLSVGSESPESLAEWQAMRLKQLGRLYHQTRMTPRRREELLQGGSIYWVIRGKVRARQKLLDIETIKDEEGRNSTLLILDPPLIRTIPRPHRAFQGWRYLEPADAPPDLGEGGSESEDLPPDLAEALRDLGIL